MKLILICMLLLCGCGPDQPTRKYNYDPGPVEYYKGLPPGRMPNKKPTKTAAERDKDHVREQLKRIENREKNLKKAKFKIGEYVKWIEGEVEGIIHFTHVDSDNTISYDVVILGNYDKREIINIPEELLEKSK